VHLVQRGRAVKAANLIALIVAIGTVQVAAAAQADQASRAASTRAVPMPAVSSEFFRPQYHFSARRHWLNDPNGLVYFEGEYHLFYQYNPFGDRWGHMSWGHAISSDLVHWHELPVAIPEDPDTMIFSGSVVVDAGNTSGFGSDGRTPLVAIYTGFQRSAAGLQNQQLAYSVDRGRTWTKYAGNPVLDLGLKEFRDPKVFWYAATQEWLMVAVLADQKKTTFFASPDLKHWRHVGDFGPAGAVDGAWECPDLIELPVTGAQGGSRWLLKVDVFESQVAGAGAQYFVGDFDGRAFTALPGETGRVVDWGRDFYAAASWAHLPASDGRHVWIGWMNNHEYAQDIPTAPWRGAMSVPRSLSLRERDGSFELLQSPVAELESLRMNHRRLVGVRLTDTDIDRATSTSVVPRLSASAEILATLRPGDSSETGLLLRVGGRERTVVGYDVASRRLFIDRTHSGATGFSDRFPGRQFAPFELDHGELKLHILLDRSSIELFAGDGELVMTEQIFPAPTSVGLHAYARGGTASLASIDLWDLKSARER
jgi:fructan beta-fructosidase